MIWILSAIGVAIVAAFFHERRCPVCARKFPTSDEMYHHLDRSH